MKHILTLVALLAVGSQSVSRADQIAIFNTGVDSSGNLLPAAAPDLHYTYTSSTVLVPTNPFVLAVDPATLGWTGNTAVSQWVSPDPGGFPGVDVFDYKTTFSLAGLDPTTAQISGSVAADDGTMVYLNGNLILDDSFNGGNAPWTVFVPFGASSGFVSGTNTLEFVTPNTGGPGGLQVIVSGTAFRAVPEPGSLALIGIGAAGLAFYARRCRAA